VLPPLDVTLQIERDSDSGQRSQQMKVTGTSAILDYMHRPLTEVWECKSLLEFCLVYRKVRLTTKEVEALAVRRGVPHRTSSPRSAKQYFTNGHPLQETHSVSMKRAHWTKLPIPCLIGGRLPKRNVHDPLYCLSVLTLGYPWRSLESILLSGEDWCGAYSRIIGENPSAVLGAMFMSFLNNEELQHTYDSSRNSDLILRNERERAALLAQGKSTRVEEVNVEEEIGGMQNIMLLTDSYNPMNLTHAEQEGANYTDRAMHVVESLLGHNASGAGDAARDGGVANSQSISYAGSSYSASLIQRCNARLKELRHGNQGAGQEVEHPPAQASTENRGRPRRNHAPHSLSPVQYAAEQKLNDQQAVCFLSYVGHAESMFAGVTEDRMGDVPTNAPTPAFWVLTGEGGSGKTHTLRAIVDYFRLRGWGRHLKVAATTGAAAANLCRSASTIDSLLGFSRNLTRKPTVASRATAFNSQFQCVYYLIVDEYSMLSITKLHDICEKLKAGQASDYPAGRISILFAGDPHQFQPVQGKGLSRFAEVLQQRSDYGGRSSAPGQHDVNACLGAALWQRISNIIVLTVNYRQHACGILHGILNRMRDNQQTDNDVLILKRQLLKAEDLQTTGKFADAQYIVQRNALRIQLSNRMDDLAARLQSRKILVVHAVDTMKTTGYAMPPELQEWIRIHGKARDCDQLQSESIYYIGQRVRFTKNLAPELGIANGAVGTIVGISLTNADMEACNSGSTLRQDLLELPTAMYVKVDHLEARVDHMLDPGVVPIGPHTAPCSLTVKREGKYMTVPFTRQAMPLLPTSCITDYKAQGSGFPFIVLDLEYPADGRTDYALALYVMLSRAQTLAGIRILRDFDATKFKSHFPEYIRLEWARLSALSITYVDHYLASENISERLEEARRIP
jgi:hypothetical protein